jgi:uncharacterized protein (DUF1330 family)
MPAYLVVDTAIENAQEYEMYKALAQPIAKSFSGVYRVHGGDMEILETNPWRPTRMVILGI